MTEEKQKENKVKGTLSTCPCWISCWIAIGDECHCECGGKYHGVYHNTSQKELLDEVLRKHGIEVSQLSESYAELKARIEKTKITNRLARLKQKEKQQRKEERRRLKELAIVLQRKQELKSWAKEWVDLCTYETYLTYLHGIMFTHRPSKELFNANKKKYLRDAVTYNTLNYDRGAVLALMECLQEDPDVPETGA